MAKPILPHNRKKRATNLIIFRLARALGVSRTARWLALILAEQNGVISAMRYLFHIAAYNRIRPAKPPQP